MEKVLVECQLCLKRLSMNGNQTKLAYETFCCNCRSLYQRFYVQEKQRVFIQCTTDETVASERIHTVTIKQLRFLSYNR